MSITARLSFASLVLIICACTREIVPAGCPTESGARYPRFAPRSEPAFVGRVVPLTSPPREELLRGAERLDAATLYGWTDHALVTTHDDGETWAEELTGARGLPSIRRAVRSSATSTLWETAMGRPFVAPMSAFHPELERQYRFELDRLSALRAGKPQPRTAARCLLESGSGSLVIEWRYQHSGYREDEQLHVAWADDAVAATHTHGGLHGCFAGPSFTTTTAVDSVPARALLSEVAEALEQDDDETVFAGLPNWADVDVTCSGESIRGFRFDDSADRGDAECSSRAGRISRAAERFRAQWFPR